MYEFVYFNKENRQNILFTYQVGWFSKEVMQNIAYHTDVESKQKKNKQTLTLNA